MIDMSPIEELRETRRRLADACGGDAERYAAMLQEVTRNLPGDYITRPLLPPRSPVQPEESLCK
jgi:hypothetical protein